MAILIPWVQTDYKSCESYYFLPLLFILPLCAELASLRISV